MANKEISSLLLLSLVVFALILVPTASGNTFSCLRSTSHTLSSVECQNNMTCNELCKFKGYKLGGFCHNYVGSKTGHCCCNPSYKSQESSLSDNTNIFITN
ncbi:hypothetical protein EUTSA_v10027134mg [Eutrema salsugineum]|uniref:Knottin scorpion toxin-like domain-containing protein n=1 Tax=Eutrema salsugineum TaxID=72664 RepID=V4M017_EUTSA|nr:hypothetical protein EUTSA_v10027134mg [Eutrema salsugineum]